MEERLIIKALRDKRTEIHGQIAAYQALRLSTIWLTSTRRSGCSPRRCQRKRYVVSHGLYKKGEIADLACFSCGKTAS